jgi:hypothetical protein
VSVQNKKRPLLWRVKTFGSSETCLLSGRVAAAGDWLAATPAAPVG